MQGQISHKKGNPLSDFFMEDARIVDENEWMLDAIGYFHG
jgi:hypothetical protein